MADPREDLQAEDLLLPQIPLVRLRLLIFSRGKVLWSGWVWEECSVWDLGGGGRTAPAAAAVAAGLLRVGCEEGSLVLKCPRENTALWITA